MMQEIICPSHTHWATLQKRNPELKELDTFITVGKHIFYKVSKPFLLKKDSVSSKAVCYTNFVDKMHLKNQKAVSTSAQKKGGHISGP